MAILVITFVFLALAALVSVFGYMYYVRPARLLDQLTNSTSDAIPASLTKPQDPRKGSITKWLEPIGNLFPVSPEDALGARQRLIAAGIRSQSSVAVYYGVKIVLALLLVIVTVVFRDRFIGSATLHALSPIIGGGLGFWLPGFLVSRRISKRQENIRLSLPDVLDLLVICTEAGCGLDQAMVNVSRDLKDVHAAVAEELAFLNMEIMAGKSRADALRNFGRRTGEDEVKKLVAILIQTDRFGTSVSDALRTQSEFLRIRRRQIAEEKAGKVGVKLVFPIFFFCLPALLIVTAGPGMLQLFHNMLPAVNSAH